MPGPALQDEALVRGWRGATPRRGLAVVALLATLGLAGWLRFSGLNWDADQHLHPDERFLTMVLTAERWPQSIGEYFDEARSPLNPRNVGFPYFAYGTLPTTLVKGAAVALGMTDYNPVVLVGRAASALADLGSILLLFAAARRLYRDTRVALLAALFLATAVLPIQHAHFFVVDTFAVLFVTAAIWALAGVQEGRRGGWMAAGVFFGLALACKASVFTFALVFGGVAFCDFTRSDTSDRSARSRGVRLAETTLYLTAAAVAAFVAFRIAAPDTFAGPGPFGLAPSGRWWSNVLQTRQLVGGDLDIPPSVQWADRTPLWFAWKNLVLWGMGPALGIAAWIGWGAAAWRLVARNERAHLVPVVWTLVLFLHQGGQFVMAGRYLLPIYPTLALLAAWLLVRAWDGATAAADGARTIRMIAAGGALAIAVTATCCWALAFTSIYRRPNTRVAASRWIYDHVPARAWLATEHWDDKLPLPLGDDLVPARYQSRLLTNYDDDTPEKLATLVEALSQTDYLILASNRLYDSIPRLPMRYPMTTAFYRQLFSGELGFERVADFTSYPSLGPLRIPDQTAEEAFSVYDHARVQILQKTKTWDAEKARVLLGRVDWRAIVRMAPRDAATFKNGLMLDAGARAVVRGGGTWSRMFDPSSAGNRWPVVVWVLVIETLGIVAFPLVALALGTLGDRGWMVSKSVGLLLVGYGGWLLASLRLWPFVRTTLVAVTATIAVASCAVVWRQRDEWSSIMKQRRALLLKEELVFWLCFGAFLAVRLGNPDLWHSSMGGEKPMDFAYLNAIVRSEAFPPYNPWFAGGYINYYYFGFVLVGALVKLTGIVPQVAYNLAVPTLFALTAGGAFSVAYAAAAAMRSGAPAGQRAQSRLWLRPFGCGIAAIVLVAVAGNLVEPSLVARAATGEPIPNWWWYWNATRAIPHALQEAPPITEFPFFAFLYGDLHAHMMALPYTLLALLLAVALVVPGPDDRASRRVPLATIGLLALTMGTLFVTNTWDYPTYLLVAVVALFARAWARREPGARVQIVAFEAMWPWLAIVVVGRLLFQPFFRHYSQAYGALDAWTGSRTPAMAYLSIHGLFLLVIASFAAVEATHFKRLARLDRSTVAIRLLVWTWVIVGAVLTVLVEFVVVRSDVGRMNTVFKFYFQVWVLWALAAAVGLQEIVSGWQERVEARRPAARLGALLWVTAFTVFVAAAAAYPVLAVPARWKDRFDPATGSTLDGQAYMRTAVHTERRTPFEMRWDLDAIRWIEKQIQGTPVILEAHMSEYRWGARISSNTGLPTILGWSWHQRQQHAALPPSVVTDRERDVEAIYSEPSAAAVLPLLDRYHVEYIYVGPLERIVYPTEGLAKFEAEADWFRQVYENPAVRIFRVIQK